MFGRATITLGIGPHSSFNCFKKYNRDFKIIYSMCVSQRRSAEIKTPKTL